MNDIFVKCTRCKKDKNIIHFMKDDKQLKSCYKCLENERLNKKKNRCSCGREKFYCKIHNPDLFCPCGTDKRYCKLHANAREIVIKNMIGHSRTYDKKKKIFDKNQFLDKQFLSNLLDLYENCIYCNCKLNFDKRNPQLATIERLDNTLGHIKRNCVVACYTCNVSHVGQKYN